MMTLNWMKDHRINTVFWVPSALCLIANLGALPELHLDDLKLIMFGGEVMPAKQLNMWRREYPDADFINMYGPTEMTDICAYYWVDREIDDSERLPIGKAAAHTKLFLLDEKSGNCAAQDPAWRTAITGIRRKQPRYLCPIRCIRPISLRSIRGCTAREIWPWWILPGI